MSVNKPPAGGVRSSVIIIIDFNREKGRLLFIPSSNNKILLVISPSNFNIVSRVFLYLSKWTQNIIYLGLKPQFTESYSF